MLKVFVHYSPPKDSYDVRFVDTFGLGVIESLHGTTPRVEYHEQEPGIETAPTFTLRDHEAQALYYSLGKALGIAGDPNFVSHRLDVETKRLDKVLDWMMRP